MQIGPLIVMFALLIWGYLFLTFIWNNLDCYYRNDCSVSERWKVCADGGSCEGLGYRGIIDGGGYMPDEHIKKTPDEHNEFNSSKNIDDSNSDERLDVIQSAELEQPKAKDEAQYANSNNLGGSWVSAANKMTWINADTFCENYPPKGRYILPTTEQLTSIVSKTNNNIVAWTRIPKGQDNHIIVDLNDGRLITTGDEDSNAVLCVVH